MHSQKKGMSMDGGMVNIRQEGWRELKVGAVFDIEMRLERPHPQADLLEMAHGVNLHYTAVLGTKDAVSPMLWALAVKHALPTARERAIIADGALWIWNLAEDLCPDGRQEPGSSCFNVGSQSGLAGSDAQELPEAFQTF